MEITKNSVKLQRCYRQSKEASIEYGCEMYLQKFRQLKIIYTSEAYVYS